MIDLRTRLSTTDDRCFRVTRFSLSVPAQVARFFRVEMEEIKKTIGAFDVGKNIPDVRASRKQRVNSLDEITLILEDPFLSFDAVGVARSPGPSANTVAARVDAFIVYAEQMYQVSTLGRGVIGLARGMSHRRT